MDGLETKALNKFSRIFDSEIGTMCLTDVLGSQDYIENVLCDLYAKLKTQVEKVVHQQPLDDGLAGRNTTNKVDYGREQMAKLASEAAAVGDSELANTLFLENTARYETNPGSTFRHLIKVLIYPSLSWCGSSTSLYSC